MTLTSLAILSYAVLAQCAARSATTYSYSASYATPAYAAPYYAAQQVITKYVPVESYDTAVLANDYVRAERKSEEKNQLQDQVTKLATMVEQLVRQQAVPQQAPVPQYAPVPSPQQSPTPQYQAAPQYQVPIKSPPLAVPPKADPYAAPLPPRVPSSPLGLTRDVAGLPAALGRCAACHTGPSAKGNLAIFASPGILAPLSREELGAIDEAVREGRMPPPQGGGPLNLAEYAELRDWLLLQPAGGASSLAQASRNPF